MKRRFSFLLLALAAVSFLAGCAHLYGRAEAPRVNIANIVPKEVKPFQQVFSLDLRVMNPTDREITIRGVVFDLEVNGQPFARGVSNLTTSIGPFATEILQVEAVTTLASLLRQIQRDGQLPLIKADPCVERIAPDPRYKALLRKLKLPQ